MRAILANPRYTGHQVWNRQRRDEVLVDIEDVGLGHETKMRWNNHTDWVWSERPVHEALIPMETFEAVQAMFGRTRQSVRRTPAEGRHYLLAGMMRCGLCGRRMQGQWNHGRPYYRCRFPDDYGIEASQHPKSVYIKEEAVVPGLDAWLAGLFDNEHLDHTCEVLAGAAEPDADYEARQNDLEAKIRDCDRRLARYREALEHVEGEVVPIARWIAEVQRERRNLEAQLGRGVPGGKLTKAQVKALVGALRDIVGVLADADPADKAELYGELGVSLTYHPDGRVAVEALPRGVEVRVGEATQGVGQAKLLGTGAAGMQQLRIAHQHGQRPGPGHGHVEPVQAGGPNRKSTPLGTSSAEEAAVAADRPDGRCRCAPSGPLPPPPPPGPLRTTPSGFPHGPPGASATRNQPPAGPLPPAVAHTPDRRRRLREQDRGRGRGRGRAPRARSAPVRRPAAGAGGGPALASGRRPPDPLPPTSGR